MMSRIPLPALEELDAETRASVSAGGVVQGFVPSARILLAQVPGLLPAVRELANVVLATGRIGTELKWFVAHVSSMAAGCRYCSAHTANHAHVRAGAESWKVAALWEFETSDAFTDRERAALRLALAAGHTPNEVTDEHFAQLRMHFENEEILELVAVIAFYGFFNRWNDTLATSIEEEPLRFAEETLRATPWARPPESARQ